MVDWGSWVVGGLRGVGVNGAEGGERGGVRSCEGRGGAQYLRRGENETKEGRVCAYNSLVPSWLGVRYCEGVGGGILCISNCCGVYELAAT